MTTTFKIDQLVSITDVQRKIGEVTARLKEEDIIVLKNNKPDFVMVDIDAYKIMKDALDFMEHVEIFHTVHKRKDEGGETMDSSQFAKKLLAKVQKLNPERA